jgi:L-fuculose-phosphate aldolase
MSLFDRYPQEGRQVIQVCHSLARNLFVTSQGGNLAWKIEPDIILITPTQVNKAEIQVDDLVFINLEGKVLEGNRRPTGETPMYLNFFRQRLDITSIIHSHPPATCAFAIREGKNWLMRPLIPETTFEVGPVPVVPYAEPLTEELARQFDPYLPIYNSFLMENHGLVTMSRGNISWTLGHMELLEMTARSIVYGLSMGSIKELSREAVRGLDKTLKTRNLPLPGAPGVNQSLELLYFSDQP